MTILNVLAMVPTADFETARAWYARVAGRPADRSPMDGCDEWQFAVGGAIQLYRDLDHAGLTQLTIAVTDLDAHATTLAQRDLYLRGVSTVPSGRFRVGTLQDPDGNRLVFAQELQALDGPDQGGAEST
ncbi:VOC family protein [Streptomyces sp. SID3343]|uniref:VOC family protein n=1 Tax=Streptomyces sp. SID3343 TaxID=2690260 RepID=UPI00136A0B92|nr:VOC family protein [Streptomyces sp. SID3343]MYV98261.1 VOC family protein [Streptomyces sp. SID3343]